MGPEDPAGLAVGRRNRDVADRASLAITPPPVNIEGADCQGPEYAFNGHYRGTVVYLGELRTDDAGRLEGPEVAAFEVHQFMHQSIAAFSGFIIFFKPHWQQNNRGLQAGDQWTTAEQAGANIRNPLQTELFCDPMRFCDRVRVCRL